MSRQSAGSLALRISPGSEMQRCPGADRRPDAWRRDGTECSGCPLAQPPSALGGLTSVVRDVGEQLLSAKL